MADGLDKIRNKVCEETLNFDETIDIGKATSEGIQKEKFLPQGTVHQIARNEARQQFKREFQHLKNKIIPSKKDHKATENESNKNKQEQSKNSTTTTTSQPANEISNDNNSNSNKRKNKYPNHINNKRNKSKQQSDQHERDSTNTNNHQHNATKSKVDEINKQLNFTPLRNDRESNSSRVGQTSSNSDHQRYHYNRNRNFQHQTQQQYNVQWRDEEYHYRRNPERFEDDRNISRFTGRGGRRGRY